ncbi:MAG: CoB--CoM heterodisulfide reductase iron-sulfur subunit B family protein [Candidatus Bathyarchaeota archaeon]|nr:MAG: CoB--CoM heterodisulfide reductase iron-sulfur subunit B family protein [Candidatus Bathyarchaeota archaeon]
MKFAFYPGCTVQTEQYAYEISTRRIFPKLGIQLLDVEDFSCCGYPLKNVSVSAWFYLAARNLALAEKLGLDIFPLCNGCNLSFCEVKHYLQKYPTLKDRINSLLSIEGLEYTGNTKSVHILQVLREVIGIDKIQAAVKMPLEGLKLATHYGCHALRPSKLEMPDDPEDPQSLEELTEASGATTEEYPERLDCCGQGLALTTGKTALAISGLKLRALQDHNFDGLVTICPSCTKMFDAKQNAIKVSIRKKDLNMPVLYITQVLGLAMGIKSDELALNLNQSPISDALKKLGKN